MLGLRAVAETAVAWFIAADAIDMAIADWKLAAMAGLIACMFRIAR